MLALAHLALGAAPRVVFTDCDGTMLTPGHALSERTRRTLDALHSHGVRIVPATGRARSGTWTANVLSHPALGGGVPGIYLNGCSVYADAHPLPPPTLAFSALESAISFGEKHKLCPIAYVSRADLSIEALHGTPASEVSAELINRLRQVGDAPLRQMAKLSPSQRELQHPRGIDRHERTETFRERRPKRSAEREATVMREGETSVVKLLLLGDCWDDDEQSDPLRDEIAKELGTGATLTQVTTLTPPQCLWPRQSFLSRNNTRHT